MTRFLSLALVALFSFIIVPGCGSADVDEKGASEKKAVMDPEQKKLMEETMNQGMQKQFGSRAEEAPVKDEE